VHRFGQRPRRRSRAGFTLVELMVVVAIAAGLAVAAIAAMNAQISSSQSIEGLTMVQSIRAAQERHRSEHGLYLDVSVAGGFYPDDPATTNAGSSKRNFLFAVGDDSHPDNARWVELLPTTSGPVRFGYLVNAGLPGAAMTATAYDVEGLEWPPANEPWYVIQAVSDLDEDGVLGYYVASSLNGEVFREREGE
jgi:prepilin-type N-terminal cleavage/methylation domain-containing protein